MSKWNSLRFQAKSELWRGFRTALNDGKEIKLLEIAEFWGDVPRGSRCLDYYTPNSWPTPWEILANSQYCVNTISLLMYYTVRLCYPDLNCQLYLIDDTEDRYIVPVVDGILVLNYEINKVVQLETLKEFITVLETYDNEQIPQVS